MYNKKIIEKKYYSVTLKLLSPLSVGNGENRFSDSDVIKNGNGEYFVPGTSLAGAFRNYLEEKDDEQGLMGFEKNTDGVESGKMSQIFISDLFFNKPPTVSIRDGVQLSTNKTVLNKFDMQVIETSATGTFNLEYILRKGETDNSRKIDDLIFGLQNGDIRLGSKKNRGFGRVEVLQIKEQSFTAASLKEYIQFLGTNNANRKYAKSNSFIDWQKDRIHPETKYYSFNLPLKQNGGISIRRYSAEPDHPDFEHLTCGPNKDPVIPGSSWNGAIRSASVKILQQLLPENDAESIVNDWFGVVDPTNNKVAKQSSVVFGESIISGAEGMPVTRTSIDRFTGAVVNGALYTEYSYFGGTTELTFMVKKDASDSEALVGLMLLICQAIQEGYIPVGGQTAIGRGVFSENGYLTDLEGNKIPDQERYKQALFTFIEKKENRK